MTKKLPVVGSSAATTVFCSAEVAGPFHDEDPTDVLFVDGNAKITWDNGSFAAPAPNAFSLVNGEDCPGATPTCLKSCYVHGIEAHAPDTHALYRHNSAKIREVLESGSHSRMWASTLARWIRQNAAGGFRWHVSGDVFSAEYARWVSCVCALSPRVRHWVYTRSFDLVGDLGADNLAVNLSADRDNWEAAFECREDWPGTRVCLMVTEDEAREYLDAGIIGSVGGAICERLTSLREGDVIFPDYALRDGTELGCEWFSRLPPRLKQMVCPVDRCGKSEERRCGPCPKCLSPSGVQA